MIGGSIKLLIRISAALLLLGALGIALLLFYLSRVDVNTYRPLVEEYLSGALRQPVSIGSGSLTIRQGLAVTLDNLRIGKVDTLAIEVPQLTATLQLLPLLEKRIVLQDVEIRDARVRLRPSPQSESTPPPQASLWNDSGYRFEVRMLSLRNGSFSLYDSDPALETPLLELENLHSVVYDWQPDRPSKLVVSGQEMHSDASFLLEAGLPQLIELEDWRTLDLEAKLQIGRYSTDTPSKSATAFSRSGRVEFNLAGIPAEGAAVTATVTVAGSSTTLFQAQGTWLSSAAEERIREISGRLFGFPVSGELHLHQAPKRLLTARLESRNLNLSAADFAMLGSYFPQGLLRGNLDRLSLKFEQHRPGGNAPTEPMQLDGHVAVSGLQWEHPRPWLISAFKTDLSFHNADLVLADTRITTDLGGVAAAGKIRQILSAPQLEVRATAAPQLEKLAALFTPPDDWNLNGTTPLTLVVDGSIDHPNFNFQADLTNSALGFGRFYTKATGKQAHLNFSGSLLKRRNLRLERIHIDVDPIHLSGHGIVHSGEHGISADISASAGDLSTLGDINPVFRRLQLRGAADLDIKVSRDQWQATGTVTNGGAHLTSLIGDLNGVTGNVALDHNGLRFQQLPARLGESSFIVDGIMRGWKSPVLELEVTAPVVRARDLVFRNPDLTLYNLRGRLVIDDNGIRFNPVVVNLEQDTQATVFGSVENYSEPIVNLGIHGEKAEVMDIINLFMDPEGNTTDIRNNPLRTPIFIDVTAREGRLRGLKFTNARTTITDHMGILSVYPLTFESSGGWSRAKVEYNRHDPVAPLKISGHVHGIDASALHHDLLDRPGLIRGPLTGDFYLQGKPGRDSFPGGVAGGAYFQVHNGTLRRFRGLAQVFSVLNVSQIFSGKLPDMDREGMPFNLLEGSARISNGMLVTDDLKITGEAMNLSLVGSQNLIDETVDFTLGVMPLRTVDKVISAIPIAGWLLTGEDRAVLTAYFRIEGANENPTVTPVPVGSISNTVLGIFRRTLGLPEKLIKDAGALLQGETAKKEATE